MEALAHQKAALAEIVARARAYFAANTDALKCLPIQPRWATILCAPTGSGKTALALMAAQAEFVEANLLRVSIPGWMPCGAHQRGARETIRVIAEHVGRNARTFLVFDEIDKLIATTGDSWQGYIRGEIYELLDGRWPTGLHEVEDENDNEIPISKLTDRLKDSVFILSIGTFQGWFDSAHTRRTIGFGDDANSTTEEISAEQVAELMPRELANRHNGTIVRLPELRAADYHRIAHEILNKMPEQMREPFRVEVERRIHGAIAAKKGVRFLEEAMTAVLVSLPPEPRQAIVETEEPKPDPNINLCTL